MEAKKYGAEFFATFGFVFLAAGSVVVNSFTDGLLGHIGISLAHGLALMAMVYAVMKISGAHINPAVTVAMWLTRNISFREGVGYVVAQLGGSVSAALLLFGLFPTTDLATSVPALASNISQGAGLLVEIVFTFLLVFTIYGVTQSKKLDDVVGASVGVVVATALLVAGPLTGAALNPARAFGPALLTGLWQNHLVYWAGPILGAVLAGLLFSYVLKKK